MYTFSPEPYSFNFPFPFIFITLCTQSFLSSFYVSYIVNAASAATVHCMQMLFSFMSIEMLCATNMLYFLYLSCYFYSNQPLCSTLVSFVLF